MRPLVLCCAVLASAYCTACSADSTHEPLVPGRASATRSSESHTPLSLSPQEEVLVRRLEGMFPGARGADLRKQLTNHDVAAVHMPNNPQAESILNEIASIRENAARERFLSGSHSKTVQTTVAMVANWPDASASSIAVHRPGKNPEFLILLPGNAGPGHLAAGLQALGVLLQKDTSTAHESRLAAHKTAIPASWVKSHRDRLASGALMQLSGDSSSFVAGLGRVRTLVLPVQIP